MNSWTVRNNYLIPLISELIDKLVGKKHFTKMNLRWGYNNVRIKKSDEWKAAFTTPDRAFELTVMYFGLMNLPSTFQTMMNNIFQDLINRGLVIIYIDDILIATESLVGHREIVEEVLQRLLDNDLFIKPEKCIMYPTCDKLLNRIRVTPGNPR